MKEKESTNAERITAWENARRDKFNQILDPASEAWMRQRIRVKSLEHFQTSLYDGELRKESAIALRATMEALAIAAQLAKADSAPAWESDKDDSKLPHVKVNARK